MEERNRLARDLHDSVTQSLYSLTLYAEAASRQLAVGALDVVAEHLGELRQAARQALQEMRLLIFELRPVALEEQGLVGAFRARLDAVEARAGVRTSLETRGDARLSPAIETGLYGIAQEALNNALKHANASEIRVSLERRRTAGCSGNHRQWHWLRCRSGSNGPAAWACATCRSAPPSWAAAW